MYSNDEFFNDINEGLQILLENPYESKELAHDIQLLLLDRIIQVEDVIRKNNETVKSNKQKARDKRINQDERKSISLETKSLNDVNEILKQDLKRLREIGDSIAFAYFNKHDLKTLCWKESAGFIGGKDGLKKELEEFEKFFKQGEFAILNDITNSLRFGDITVEKDGKPHFLEIKSSIHSDARIQRQEKNLKERIEFLNNDYVENLFGSSMNFKRIYSSNPEKNCIDRARDLIDKAIKTGYVIDKIEEGLTYIFMYKEEKFEFLKKLYKNMNDPQIIYVNSMKSIVENYVPFPKLINNPYALMEFYNGNLILTVAIETGIVRSKLESLGYELSSIDEKGWTVKFNNNGIEQTVLVSTFHINRIGREFVSLEWIIMGIHEVIEEAKRMKNITTI